MLVALLFLAIYEESTLSMRAKIDFIAHYNHEELSARLQGFAQELAVCAGLPGARVLVIDFYILRYTDFNSPSDILAFTRIRGFIDILERKSVDIVLIRKNTESQIKAFDPNNPYLITVEGGGIGDILPHEIAHHLIKPTVYHKLWEKDISDKTGKEIESWADEEGIKLFMNCHLLHKEE